jgi:hypothetical protein
MGTCTLIGNSKYCTTACPPTCPQGTHCSIVGGNSICVPDLDQCAKCSTSADCTLPSSNCLTAPLGDAFCAQDCTVDGMCPNGFVCTSAANYAALDAGVPEGGADGGGTGGGGTGSAEAGTPGEATMWCVPDDGASCPCTVARDGVTNTCFVTNANGSCPGMETCSGEAAMWTGCTGMTPMPEICNGKDDNCNGQIDEGNPDSLCAFMGAPPPNANWACVNGMCQLGTCQPGWTAYPSGNATTGCSCQVDANEPNDVCSQATNAGSVTSTSTTPITLMGNLSSDTDVDVFTFDSLDPSPSGSNPYHVSLSFTAPSPNTEFVMDVIRSSTCTDTPTGNATDITSYDWCVNGTGMVSGVTVGEAPCGPSTANQPHCTDHSSKYYVRVHRATGVTGTCTNYAITVTGSGGTCNVTQTCP